MSSGKQGKIINAQSRETIANVTAFMKKGAEYKSPISPLEHFRQRAMMVMDSKMEQMGKEQKLETKDKTICFYSANNSKNGNDTPNDSESSIKTDTDDSSTSTDVTFNSTISPSEKKPKRIHGYKQLAKLAQEARTSASKLLLETEKEDTSKKPNILKTVVNIIEKLPDTKYLKLEWYDKSLNFYQKEAVRNILLGEARPLPYVIFGPPGTGKTVTVVETILQLLRMLPYSRLLVTAPSNSAVNIIARRIMKSGILQPGDWVRIVSHNSYVCDDVPVDLIPFSATVTFGRETSETTLPNGMRLGMNTKMLGKQRLTLTTCGVSGNLYTMGIPKGTFTHFIVDEAAQTNEPSIMMPLSFVDYNTSQIILAGDPMQLSPSVLSIAKKLGLAESYVERIIARFPYIKDKEGFPNTGGYDPRLVTKLIYNYRSLPEVIVMPNKLFYDSELKATISETESEEASVLQKIKEVLPQRVGRLPPGIVFHGVIGENYQTADCPSWFNPDEVSQVFYYINELYRLGISSTEIGVITPYIKQARVIREVLKEAEFDLPKIGSIEDFQGNEFKIIIVSTVRSKRSCVSKDIKYNLGFLTDSKRINVALTRAHCVTIIIGNPHILSIDSRWKSIIRFCLANGSYCGCEYQLTT